MADTSHETDINTRANLAYIWTAAIIFFVGYVVYAYGEAKEILTLLIGFITGAGGTILAVYFGAPIAAKKADNTPTVQQADNVQIDQTKG